MIDEIHEEKELNSLDKISCIHLYNSQYVGDLFLAEFISELESNTCVKFTYLQTNLPSEQESDYTICYIPDLTKEG